MGRKSFRWPSGPTIPRHVSRSTVVFIFLLYMGTSTFLGFRAGRVQSPVDYKSSSGNKKSWFQLPYPVALPFLEDDASNGRVANYETRSDKVRDGAPGERAVPIPLSSFENKSAAEAVFRKEMFNLMASDIISLQRRLPENREKRCQERKYDIDLPAASVIIVFFNEPLSSLLRTVWSVINRSRPEHLREIIMVDDASDRAELSSKLDSHINLFGPLVRILRSDVHKGLIKGKLRGARNATAKVLVFLDSHCEVNVGWLEPLLSRIKENNKLVACPLVDSILAEDLGYTPSANWATGLFTWSLYYKWGPKGMIAAETKRIKDSNFEPHKTPTFPGGLFAMYRDWFFEVGAYDEDMEGWGGENLEMSFRVWMCHGAIEFVPCSRVGHISRGHTYNFVEEDRNHGINSARLAEVWMDNYKRLFYMARPELKTADLGDLSKRKALRGKLQCHDFRWYLENVYAEKFIPDEHVRQWGQLRNKETGFCLAAVSPDEHSESKFDVRKCLDKKSRMYWLQVFALSMENEIRREEWCLDGSNWGAGLVELNEVLCSLDAHRTWTYTEDFLLVNDQTKLCLDLGDSLLKKMILKPCNSSSPAQQWHFA